MYFICTTFSSLVSASEDKYRGSSPVFCCMRQGGPHVEKTYSTLSILNYKMFDFFDIKVDHSSYLKNLCKHSPYS